MFEFRLIKSAGPAGPRLGEIATARGVIETPVFMPVGTYATVKTLTPEDLKEIGAAIILSNTYHLYLRPGVETIAGLGGLHRFMHWDGPILTDSGGYQIFSLAPFRTVTDEGVTFRSHLDGTSHFLTPEAASRSRRRWGRTSRCPRRVPGLPAPEPRAKAAALTLEVGCPVPPARTRPTRRCSRIVQGGRVSNAAPDQAQAGRAGFDGYAIGGLSVGEPKDISRHGGGGLPDPAGGQAPLPHGRGTPGDLVEAVCPRRGHVRLRLPTRIARNGTAFTRTGRVVIKNALHGPDPGPLDAACGCYTCRQHSRAYLRHPT